MSARLFAALLLIALGAVSGRLAGERVRRRARALDELACDMERLKTAMLQERLPLDEALERCKSPLLPGQEGEDCLTGDDQALLSDLLGHLGQGTAADQALLLPRMQARLREARDQANARYLTLGRLYPSLGALAALALALAFV